MITSVHKGALVKADPLVSVIIPAYNVAPYIQETLASVFAQTFGDYEVVLVNDESPDTMELRRAIGPWLERIVYIEQKNSGPGGARNSGIGHARGEYVGFLDGDDLWEPDFLAVQVEALTLEPSVDLVCADALLFGSSVHRGKTFFETVSTREPVTLESLLSIESAIITSGVLARRSALERAGLFDPQFYHSEDFDLWARLVHRGGRIRYTRRCLARHRIHQKSLAYDSTRLLDGQSRVYRKLKRVLNPSEKLEKLIDEQIERCEATIALEHGKRAFAQGDYARAAELIARANSFYSSRKLSCVLAGLKLAPRLLHALYRARQRALPHRFADAR